jgi:hypothetical protein
LDQLFQLLTVLDYEPERKPIAEVACQTQLYVDIGVFTTDTPKGSP